MYQQSLTLYEIAVVLGLALFCGATAPACGKPAAGEGGTSRQSASPQGSLTQPANRAANPQALFAEGQRALQRGDLDTAEAAFRRVIAMDPGAGAAYSNLGVIAMRRKEWDRAIALLQKASRLEPKVAGIRLNIGLVEYRRGHYAAAIAPLKMNATSHVTAGENDGRTLAHQFIALNLVRTDLSESGDSFGADLSYPIDRADALAVWVTRSGSLTPIQAAGGFLR